MLHFIIPDLCVTHATNPSKVNRYIDLLKAGVKFPPIEVIEKEGRYYVIDGAHRTAAFRACQEKILAFIYEEENCPKKHLIGRRLYYKVSY